MFSNFYFSKTHFFIYLKGRDRMCITRNGGKEKEGGKGRKREEEGERAPSSGCCFTCQMSIRARPKLGAWHSTQVPHVSGRDPLSFTMSDSRKMESEAELTTETRNADKACGRPSCVFTTVPTPTPNFSFFDP